MDQRGAIYLRTRTWIRDSHDLFDYEAKNHVIERDFCTNVGTMIVRNNNSVYCVDQRVSEQTRANGMEHPDYDHLLCVKPDDFNNYYIIPADRPFIHNKSHFTPKKLWLVVRNLPKKRYVLEENDIIKLGRFRLRVKQMIKNEQQLSNFGESSILEPETEVLTPNKSFSDHLLSGSSMTSFDPSPSQSNDIYPSVAIDRSMGGEFSDKVTSDELLVESDATTDVPNRQCRICLSEGDSVDDKLICACECRGSIKFVHSNCLKRWINSKWNIKNGFQNPDMVFIREVACELCKSKYPTKVIQNGKVVQIVTLPKMKPPLLVLENITPYAVKGYHLLSMANMKDLKLGRGHESDLRIPDVSISRYHATITHENGSFYLQDHDSKFGTLVAIRKPRLIKPTGILFDHI